MDPRFFSTRYKGTGTAFRLYPQPRTERGFRRPETVYVHARPGTIRPGPRDDRVYVVDAVNKEPYRIAGGQPPYRGDRRRAVRPGTWGHFVHVQPSTPAFSSAMMFATVKCVLDIWERYLGRRLALRLELIPRALSDNAWSFEGYIECGFQDFRERRRRPYAENFDVVAHEVGHRINHVVIGVPTMPRPLQYRALDEALADLIAIVSALHSRRMVERLLHRTRGNLCSRNVLSGIGERGRVPPIRRAFQGQAMSLLGEKWDPDPDAYRYTLTEPFTGGAFDVLLGIYLTELGRRGVLPGSVIADLMEDPGETIHAMPRAMRRRFTGQFRERGNDFQAALLDARDYFGRLLAGLLRRTRMHDPSYPTAVAHMLDADAELSGGRHRQLIRELFRWREILSTDHE